MGMCWGERERQAIPPPAIPDTRTVSSPAFCVGLPLHRLRQLFSLYLAWQIEAQLMRWLARHVSRGRTVRSASEQRTQCTRETPARYVHRRDTGRCHRESRWSVCGASRAPVVECGGRRCVRRGDTRPVLCEMKLDMCFWNRLYAVSRGDAAGATRATGDLRDVSR